MKPQIEPRQIISNTEGKKFKLHDSPVLLRHLTQLVVTQQYSNPQLAAIREIVSNAYDANLEAQKQDGVERQVGIKVLPDRVIVRDYGFGLSPAWMEEEYISITKSTKHEDQDLIGAKGIGRLSPLAVSKQYFVTSYYAGLKTTYCVYLNENSEIAISQWDQTLSNEASGLEVTIIYPSSVKDDLLDYVYHVVEGTRYKVKLDLDDLDDVPKDLIWLQDYLIDSVDDDDITVDIYSQRKVGQSNAYIYIDLGGALYPIKGDTYGRKRIQDHIKKNTQRDSWFRTNFNNLVCSSTPGTIIIRTKPDYVILNTSREDILNRKEESDKLDNLADRALKALTGSYTQYLQKKIQDEFEKVIQAYANDTAYKKLYNLFSAVNESTVAYFRQSIEGTFDIDLGDGWSACLHSAVLFKSDYNIKVEGKVIYIQRDSFLDTNPNGSVDVCTAGHNYYYLTADHGMLSSLDKDGYKWGKHKVVPKASRRHSNPPQLTVQTLLKAKPFIVFCEDKVQLSTKKIEKHFKTQLGDNPVVVIDPCAWDKQAINNLGELVNFLGTYEVAYKDLKGSKPVVRVIPDVSILMRQLKQSTWKCQDKELFDKVTEIITPELLQEKVIYMRRERTNLIANYIPDKYLADYYPVIFTVTENAHDRISELVSKGDCNWVKAKDINIQLAHALYEDYGYLVKYIGKERYSDSSYYSRRKLLELLREKKLDKYLPDLTRSVIDFGGNLTQCFTLTCEYNYPDLEEKTATLFSPYIGEYKLAHQSMLGPLLSPYYEYLILNYQSSNSQEQIYKDIAYRLESEGASIYKQS